MSRSKLFDIIVLLVLILTFILSSCKTPEPVVVTEYVPIELDIAPSVQIVYDTRPELSPKYVMDEDKDAKTLLATNLVIADQFGYEWQLYAFRLEDLIEELKGVLKKKD